MTSRHDDTSRAAAYLASDKPLFQSRNRPHKYLHRSTVSHGGLVSTASREDLISTSSRDAPILSAPEAPESSFPARKPFTTRGRASLTDAWERATREDEHDAELLAAAGSSPSPAPRRRPLVAENRYETVDAWRRETMISTRGARSVPDRLDATYERRDDRVSSGNQSESSTSGATVGVDPVAEDIARKIRQDRRDRARMAAATSSKQALFTNTWGQRARPQKGWMARIMSPESLDENHGREIPAESAESVDWAAAAVEAPLPPAEEEWSRQEPTPPHSRPTSAQPQDGSPQRSRIWDAEQDFTAQSLLISTSPLAHPRDVGRHLDTEELPEMVPLPPLLPLLDTLDIPAPDEDLTRGALRLLSRILTPRSKSSKSSSQRSSLSADPEVRIVAEASLFELPDVRSERNSLRTPSVGRTEAVDETSSSKPGALSLPTPVVTGAYPETPTAPGPEPYVKLTSARIKEMLNAKPREKKPRRKSPLVTNTAQTFSVHEDLKVILDAEGSSGSLESERSSTSAVSPVETQGQVQAKTDRAFQEAPMAPSTSDVEPVIQPEVQVNASSPSLSPSSSPTSTRPSIAIRPAHRQSRRQSRRRMTKVKSEGQVSASSSSCSTCPEEKSLTIPRARRPSCRKMSKVAKSELESETIDFIHARDRARRKELKTLELLEKTLQSSLQHVRSAKNCVEHLEDQVSSGPHTTQSLTPSSSAQTLYLMLPIPRLWKYSQNSRFGFQFTGLGLMIFLFFLWLFAETVVCDSFCRPQYSFRGNRRWNPDDPLWGYALPTVANRISGGILGSLWGVVVWLFAVVMNLDHGWDDDWQYAWLTWKARASYYPG